MLFDLAVFLVLAVVAVAGAFVLARLAGGWYPPMLLAGAVIARVVGSTARHELIFRFYNGLGDAVRYYEDGMAITRLVWSGQLLPFAPSFWLANGQWWGTEFLIRISALVTAAIGPSLRGEFLVFALLAFLGLYLMAAALRNSQPQPEAHLRCAAWLWLWPSLWFWPSSVGKEAVLMLAVGLAAYGYVGRGKAVAWLPFLAGIGLAFCIRPHVAAALALAAVTAQWIGSWERFTARRLIEVVVAVVLAFVALTGMREQLGLADADLEGVVEFVQYRAEQTLQGGSKVAPVPFGPQGVPIAFANVWMRPFPWDVHNATSAMAALELLVFWGAVWHRRRAVLFAVKRWRRHRLLRFGVPLLVLYTLMIGLTFANLGIIARQRVLVFPFMLLLLAAAPDPAQAAERPEGLPEPAVRRAA